MKSSKSRNSSAASARKTGVSKKTLTEEEVSTSAAFFEQLSLLASGEKEKNARFFRDETTENKFLGVRYAEIFLLAKHHIGMSLKELKKLLNSPFYEARLGAVSIMDYQARDKKTTAEEKNYTHFI